MAESTVQELLLALAAALRDANIDHALIGGLALGPRGFPRGTKDVDFLIDDSAIPRVRELMHARGAETLIEGDEFSSYLDDRIRADFQHARRPISKEMLARAEMVDFAGASIPVLQAEDLIGLKVQAYHNNPRRLQDRVDIQQLLEANWDKLDLVRIRTYFALFDREADLDIALRLVPQRR
ncbi:MAG: nucleotidyl transferase AbiEii/AbiGii toxin family protein [Dokdonella sp.]